MHRWGHSLILGVALGQHEGEHVFHSDAILPKRPQNAVYVAHVVSRWLRVARDDSVNMMECSSTAFQCLLIEKGV